MTTVTRQRPVSDGPAVRRASEPNPFKCAAFPCTVVELNKEGVALSEATLAERATARARSAGKKRLSTRGMVAHEPTEETLQRLGLEVHEGTWLDPTLHIYVARD